MKCGNNNKNKETSVMFTEKNCFELSYDFFGELDVCLRNSILSRLSDKVFNCS